MFVTKNFYIFIVLTVKSLIGQNLVPNPSFESITGCPTSMGYPCPFTNVGSFSFVDYWRNPICTSPEILHSCAGNSGIGVPLNNWGIQQARTGLAYAGIFSALNQGMASHFSEYISSPLNSPLLSGYSYIVSFYVSCGNSNNFKLTNGTNGIGAYLSQNIPDTTGSNVASRLFSSAQLINPTSNVIKDTINWVLISDTIIALGNEDYITIGNFTPEASIIGDGVYFYVDDVSVSPLNPLTTQVPEKSNKLTFDLSPNPANNKIQIHTPTEIKKIVIQSSDGLNVTELVKIEYIQSDFTIDINNLDDAVYFITMTNRNGYTVTKRFIKNSAL